MQLLAALWGWRLLFKSRKDTSFSLKKYLYKMSLLYTNNKENDLVNMIAAEVSRRCLVSSPKGTNAGRFPTARAHVKIN